MLGLRPQAKAHGARTVAQSNTPSIVLANDSTSPREAFGRVLRKLSHCRVTVL